MKKIGLIFDSTSGFSKEEADRLNVGLIPIMISDKDNDYRGNIDITIEGMKEIWKRDKKTLFRTSSPRPKDIVEVFDNMLEKFDEAIVISVSKKVSGTYNVINKIIHSDEKYLKRIHILDTIFVSPFPSTIVEDAFEFLKESDDVELLMRALSNHQQYIKGWVVPGHIIHFFRGGRITKSQYTIASILRIKIILTVFNGIIDPKETNKARNERGLIAKIAELLNEFKRHMYSKFDDLTENDIHGVTLDLNGDKYEELERKVFKASDLKDNDLSVVKLGTEQTAHLGPDSIAIGLAIRLKYFLNKEINN